MPGRRPDVATTAVPKSAVEDGIRKRKPQVTQLLCSRFSPSPLLRARRMRAG
jgi:hypothetical protein